MNEKPLVVQVVWSLGRAGAERMVLDLARQLPSRGFRVLVVSLGGGGEMEREFRAAGIALRIAPPTSSTRERWRLVRFLYAIAKEERPAVWHTHLGGDLWGGCVAWLRRLHPWIITAHGRMMDEPRLWQMARGVAYRHADQVVSVSDDVQDYIRAAHRLRAEKTRVIRIGIDLHHFPSRGSAPYRDIPRLVMVARLDEGKNHATLLRALAPIRRPWTLDLFGTGPEQERLMRLAESLGILPRVHFYGSVMNIPDRLRASDLFCFPTRHEGQSVALLEAAASGVPIIASDLPVFRESFDEEAMRFVPADAVKAWTRAIEDALADPVSALRRAARAEQIARRDFSLERMASEYAKLYRAGMNTNPS
jgi:glycosyltransferase involved in cell wall biosynthesis